MQDVIITLANEQYSAEKKIEVKNPRLTDNKNKKKKNKKPAQPSWCAQSSSECVCPHGEFIALR